MAEAFLNVMAPEHFQAESAGIEPGTLNPIVVDVMKDAGIDIANNKTKGVDDLIRQGRSFDYVITVCDEANAERCPVLPGSGKRFHMGFEDPSALKGDDDEKKEKIAGIRDQIKLRLEEWIKEHCDDGI
jgi:arsenate reductase